MSFRHLAGMTWDGAAEEINEKGGTDFGMLTNT